jgi:hypothetical protein
MRDMRENDERITTALWRFWQRGRTIERIGYTIAALLIASGLVHLAILLISGGSWEGPRSLRKAMSFGLSFGLTLLTIIWVASFLQLRDRTRTLLLGLFTVVCIFETALVSLQAWRGVPSHFNLETRFDALVARSLAVGGAVIIATIVTLTIIAFRRHGLATGAVMIARGMRLVFAGDPERAYTTAGTLRPTHAVTMHAILLLPMLAWLLSFSAWPERTRLRLVLLAAAIYLTIIIVIATR